MTLRRVCVATISGRLSTRETVAVETPARLATAKILGTEVFRIGEIIAFSKKTCPHSAIRLASCKRLHQWTKRLHCGRARGPSEKGMGTSADLKERMHDGEGCF